MAVTSALDMTAPKAANAAMRVSVIAARISRAADAPIEVRQCMDAPPDDVMEQIST
jgi:hypothetical protein